MRTLHVEVVSVGAVGSQDDLSSTDRLYVAYIDLNQIGAS